MKIFLALLFLLTVLSHSCDDSFKKVDQATINNIDERLGKEIQNEEDRFDSAIYEYYDLLYDLVKIRYRVLLPSLDTIISARRLNRHKYEVLRIALEGSMDVAPTDLLEYQKEMIDFDSIIMIRTNQIIYRNYEVIGFDKNEVNQYLESKREEYNSIKNNNLIKIKDEGNLLLKLKLICLANYERLKYLEETLMELSGGKPLNCFGKLYFPVVFPETNIFDKEKMGVIRVGVGQYSTSINPPDARMIIRNDTIHMADDGTFSYELTPKSRGEHILEIKIIIKNPLTGEWSESVQGEYVYLIK